jgi:hypothetical protein
MRDYTAFATPFFNNIAPPEPFGLASGNDRIGEGFPMPACRNHAAVPKAGVRKSPRKEPANRRGHGSSAGNRLLQ